MKRVGSRKNTASTSEENAEGSGILIEEVIKLHASVIHPTMENAAAVDIESEKSGVSSKTLNEKQFDLDGSGMGSSNIDENDAEFVMSKTNVEAKQPFDSSNTEIKNTGIPSSNHYDV